MALTSEQVNELKSQLISQIKHLPPDKKAAALEQINSLSPQALESMIKQQKKDTENIFRMIVSGEIDSVKVGENSHAIAVLDINPISKGHSLIILKSPVGSQDKIPKEAFSLAEEISKKIISKLNAKEAKAITNQQFGEYIIHLIPIYDTPLNLDSPRSKAFPEDLNEIKKAMEVIKIEKKPEVIKIAKKKGRKPSPIRINRRIP